METSGTTSAHTPGPWRLDGPYRIIIDMPPNYVEGYMVMNADERHGESFPIARVTGPAYFGREDRCDPELVANARLLAAAPELLEALDNLLAQTVDRDLAFGIELTPGEQGAREKALSAIAKATGGAA